MRPDCTVDDARRIAHSLFGIEGGIKQLASYSDQNFLVGNAYVLKVANSSEPEPVLRFQQEALMYVNQRDPGLNTPRVIPLLDKRTLGRWQGIDEHLVWMVNYIPGQFISDVEDHSQSLFIALGEYMGRLDRALDPFEHDAMERDLQWDLKHAARLTSFLPYINEAEQRDLVEHFLERFDTIVDSQLPALRTSVIHNDANDNNILIDQAGDHIKGIIDFGDMLHTYTICELAIAIAYMILGKEDVLDVAVSVARGYHAAYPLQAGEVEVLFDLICVRLCTSVCMSARERLKEPDNAYLAVSEAPAWRALRQLAALDPNHVSHRLKEQLF